MPFNHVLGFCAKINQDFSNFSVGLHLGLHYTALHRVVCSISHFQLPSFSEDSSFVGCGLNVAGLIHSFPKLSGELEENNTLLLTYNSLGGGALPHNSAVVLGQQWHGPNKCMMILLTLLFESRPLPQGNLISTDFCSVPFVVHYYIHCVT